MQFLSNFCIQFVVLLHLFAWKCFNKLVCIYFNALISCLYLFQCFNKLVKFTSCCIYFNKNDQFCGAIVIPAFIYYSGLLFYCLYLYFITNCITYGFTYLALIIFYMCHVMCHVVCFIYLALIIFYMAVYICTCTSVCSCCLFTTHTLLYICTRTLI